MRGIGQGQTIELLVTPEVHQLMRRQLSKAGRASTATISDAPALTHAVIGPTGDLVNVRRRLVNVVAAPHAAVTLAQELGEG